MNPIVYFIEGKSPCSIKERKEETMYMSRCSSAIKEVND